MVMQVDHVLLQGEDLSSILFRFNESDFAFSTFENLRMDSSDLIDDDGQVTTPSSILEDPVQYHGCSASRAATDCSPTCGTWHRCCTRWRSTSSAG